MSRDHLITLIPRLRRYARVLTRDATLADDLVQDTLARACEKLGQFQPGTDLRAWLFTMMHNLNASDGRRRLREQSGLEQAQAGRIESSEAPEDTLDLQRALAALPLEQRQVLLLVCTEDFSYAEVARVLDVPIGTVMSRLSRARQALREAVGDGGFGARPGPVLRVLK